MMFFTSLHITLVPVNSSERYSRRLTPSKVTRNFSFSTAKPGFVACVGVNPVANPSMILCFLSFFLTCHHRELEIKHWLLLMSISYFTSSIWSGAWFHRQNFPVQFPKFSSIRSVHRLTFVSSWFYPFWLINNFCPVTLHNKRERRGKPGPVNFPSSGPQHHPSLTFCKS